MWLWLAPVLVLVVAAAVVVPVLMNSGDDSPGSSVATEETTDAPAKPAAEDWSVKEQRPANEFGLGAWVVDDLLVFANESNVIAYDRADGAEKWRVAPPEGVFCAASDREVDGVAVLAFGPGEIGDPYTVPCGTATPLDLRKGKLGWQGKFTPPQNVSPDKVRSGAALEIVGDMVVIAQDEGMVGLDRANGTQKWAKDVQHQKTGELGCKAYDLVATGKDVVVGQSCINETGIVTFSRIDPATGETTQTADYSSSEAGGRLEFPDFVSADPLIAWLSETETSDKLVVLSDDLQTGQGIATGDPTTPGAGLARDAMGFDRLGDTQHHPTRLLVDGDTVYGVTMPVLGAPNTLAAYDLTTGKQKWAKTVDDARVLQPVAVEDGALVVAGGSVGRDGPVHTIKVSTEDGSVKSDEKSKVVDNEGDTPQVEFFRFFWADNRMYAIRGTSNVSAGMDVFAYGS
jgi:outer membrane protein assembly factor BamB